MNAIFLKTGLSILSLSILSACDSHSDNTSASTRSNSSEVTEVKTATATSVTTNEPNSKQTVSIQVQGSVMDINGIPIEGAHIELDLVTSTTDASGTYFFNLSELKTETAANLQMSISANTYATLSLPLLRSPERQSGGELVLASNEDEQADKITNLFDGALISMGVAVLNSKPIARISSPSSSQVDQAVTVNAELSSDEDNDELMYYWQITSTSSDIAPIKHQSSDPSFSFTPTAAGTYSVNLLVNDGTSDSLAEQVDLLIHANQSPNAHAGISQSLNLGDSVRLSGSESTDLDGDSLNYFWSLQEKPKTSSLIINTPEAMEFMVKPDVAGTYLFALSVDDGQQSSSNTALVKLFVEGNPMPVANAGINKDVDLGSQINLDGSQSYDPDNENLSYTWSIIAKPNDSQVQISSTNQVKIPLWLDAPGDYTFELSVTDEHQQTAVAQVTYTATLNNNKPQANAGDNQTTLTGETVYLSASASADPDNDLLTYQWALLSQPSLSAVSINNTTNETLSFVPDHVGTYVLQLIVNDGYEDSNAVTVKIEVQQAGISLYTNKSFFGGKTQISFPHTNGACISSMSVAGANTVSLQTYTLKALGADFTVINLETESSLADIKPTFSGLVNKQVLTSGTEQRFSLKTPLTNGRAATLSYSFDIAETGDSFFYQCLVTTN